MVVAGLVRVAGAAYPFEMTEVFVSRRIAETGAVRGPGRAIVAIVLLASALIPGPASAETRSFVLSYFYPADYYGDDTCPDGLNPLADVFFKRDLKVLGMPQAEVDAMFDKDYKIQNGLTTTRWVAVAATRGNGRDSVYLHPTTVPDAHLKPAVGRYGYGFNLDGRGAESPNSYEDPETHEKGVNNELFRAMGCIQVYKGYPPPQPPLEPEYRWDDARPGMGAWLISITGKDLARDGEVTVTFETSIDPVTTQDANAHIRSDMTYRVASTPASRNVLRGRIKDGVITTDPARIEMRCDAYIQPLYEFRKARMRLKIRPDGTLGGVLGAYQPWYPIYWSHAKVGYIDERGFGVDAPALYYALRRYADADQDPATGRNMSISAAYAIEAVPAFVEVAQENRAGGSAAASQRPDSATTLTRKLCASIDLCDGAAPKAWSTSTSRDEPDAPGAAALSRRLTAGQYRRAIADAFGSTIKVEGRFEPEMRDSGLLAVGAGRVGVTAAGMEQYDAMARSIAAQVVDSAHRNTLVPCAPKLVTEPDDRCAREFFAKVAPALLRRPVSAGELGELVSLARASSQTLKSFYSGLEMSLAGLLVSPQFLFRAEAAEPDPTRPGLLRLDSYSKASQLSFFLWDAPPDSALLAAARFGQLNTRAGLFAQVDRMLNSSRLESGVRAFFADMLQFDLFDTLAKDAKIYPKWTAAVASDAQEQTLRTIVDLLLTQRGDYRELFTTRRTYLTPLLGSIYRVPVAPSDSNWTLYEFAGGDSRVGIQSHASFVALHSHEGASSPTLRGKALRELLLCEPVPAPPANVNFAVAQDTHNPNFKTMRDRLTAHRTDPTCAGCHKLMDPAGLALENFDSDGGLRLAENGRRIDASGELDGILFSDTVGLGQAIHDNPATGACLVRRMYSYATGRAPTRRDMPWIRFLEKTFAEDGYRVPALMGRIAASDNLYRVAGATTTLAMRNASLEDGTK